MNSLKSNGSAWINDGHIQFHEHVTDYLARALKELRSEKDYSNSRIVAFIDDLDRCMPERALEVLESIKSFFDIEGIVYVIGMNYESINRIIEEKYGKDSGIDGFEYMQKIVGCPFPIPLLNEDDISDS